MPFTPGRSRCPPPNTFCVEELVTYHRCHRYTALTYDGAVYVHTDWLPRYLSDLLGMYMYLIAPARDLVLVDEKCTYFVIYLFGKSVIVASHV